MKRKILILLAAVLTVGVCVVGYTQSSRSSKSTATSQESPRELQREARHKEREERRAQRLAEYEHFLDSIVLARNFQFNPQSMQQQPAGSTRILNNPNYLLTIWGSEVDVCLPFIKGVTPPYYPVLLNYTLIGMPGITIYGAPIASLTCYTISMLPNLWYVRKYTGMKLDLKGILLKPALATALMGAVLALAIRLLPSGRLWTLALVLERALSGFAVAAFPLAKDTGLAHTFATAADKQTVCRFLCGLSALLILALTALGGGGLAAAALLALWRYYFVAKKQFGGITGDLAGWFLQRAELWMLAALAVSQWGGVL